MMKMKANLVYLRWGNA